MFDLYSIFALVFAITVHEFSHAWMANYLGDPTAKYEGRISLNPLRHLDPMGTLMLFLIHIGWGKPVPVNPHNFRHPKRDEAKVAFAGPLANLLTAIVFSVPFKYFADSPDFFVIFRLSHALFSMSILLCVFNLLPFPPLDGSKIIGIFVPVKWHRAYHNYLADGVRYFFIFLIIDTFILGRYFGRSFLSYVIFSLSDFVASFILFGT